MINIKKFENFNLTRFVRFTHKKMEIGEIYPSIRYKYKNIDDFNKGVYEWSECLVYLGFPDNKKAIHFMTEKTAESEYRCKLYGENKYLIELKNIDSKIGWSFYWPINEWYYKINFYLSDRCIFVNEFIKRELINLKNKEYIDLTIEDCQQISKTLSKYGFIGFGKITVLGNSNLYGKEKLFIWTSDPVIVSKY